MGIFWDTLQGGLTLSEIKIASQDKVCPECMGAGIKELEPFYFITCLWCGGTGKEGNNAETESKPQE
jgi:DnaJ-class molecular chaperone